MGRGNAESSERRLLAEPVTPQALGRTGERQVLAANAAASLIPHFKLTAGDQLDPKKSDPLTAARVRLRDAYTPSQPVTNRSMLAGRGPVLRALISAIEEQRLHSVIYGERGIGKTSLLHALEQAAREARYLVVYVSCGADSSFDEVFRAIAAGIPLLYVQGYGPTTPQAEHGDTVASLLPATSISTRTASELLARVVGTRVLVLLDEFDRSESRLFRHNVAELLKNLSDRSVRVQLVVAGVATDLTELVERIPSIQRNIFALEVPKMSNEEVGELIATGARACGLSFDSAATRSITAVAAGLPYLASLISHHAGLKTIGDGRMRVTEADVSNAVTEALDELRARLSKHTQNQIDACQSNGITYVLGTLAGSSNHGEGRFSPQDVRSLFPKHEDAARFAAKIEELVEQNILISAIEDDYGRLFRFLEEGASPYLSLLAAKTRFLDDGEERVAKSVTVAAPGGRS